MPERARSNEPLLELPAEDGLSTEHLDSQVQKAQEQLLQLKRQQETIERQKRELEELSKRQEQLQVGRTEMVEKFTRALVVVERETYEAEKRVDQLRAINEAFIQHLAILEGINPKAWDQADINKELNKALSAVDDARAEYSRSRSKITSDDSDGAEDAALVADPYQIGYAETEKGFLYWLKSGFAFTLPILILGIAFLLLLIIRSAGY
jgi:SMC interacting uncharacterized protein involved in chromosome segregation